MHKYDFEFGGVGRQSIGFVYGAGISYGYSIPLCKRLNLDFNARVGYFSTRYLKYRPVCGEFSAMGTHSRNYLGIIELEISLV